MEKLQNFIPSSKNPNLFIESIITTCERVLLTGIDQAYILCLVKYDSRIAINDEVDLNSNAANITIAPVNFNYHDFTQKLRDSSIGAQQQKICSHGYRNSMSAASPVPAMKFSPRQFLHPKDYKIDDVSIHQLLAKPTTPWSPFKNFDEIRASAFITESLDAQWLAQDQYYQSLFETGDFDQTSFEFSQSNSPTPMPVWRYFATTTGAIRVYPAVTLADDYDPTHRDWFKLAMTNPNKLFITTPYLDGFGMGYVVTIAKAIKINEGKDTVYGVLATDYFLGQVGNLLLSNLELCRLHPKNCLLVDSTGAVIFWDEFNTFNNTAINEIMPLYLDQLYYKQLSFDIDGNALPTYQSGPSNQTVMDLFQPNNSTERRPCQDQCYEQSL